MGSRRDLPVGSQSRPASPFSRRPSVSTHQPPPSTPQFGREPHIAYVTPSARPGEAPTREFPLNAPKGPKALYSNNPPVLPSSTVSGGGSGGGGPPTHSPHKSSFPSSTTPLPHHGGHGHYYTQSGGQGPSSRGSVPPPGPRAAIGRGAPAMPSAGQSRSPVSVPGSGSITTSGGPVFPSSYPTSNESDRVYRGGRQRSSEWESGIGTGRGGRGRSREREYLEYGRGGGSDYGARGGGAFGGQGFRDRERDFRDGRGGYRGRSRERGDIFQHRARSSSRERERGLPVYTSGRCDRERSERGGFAGDRRPGFERERLERERERDRELTRERDRERERERERERLEREARFSYKQLDRDSRESRVVERPREAREVYDPSRGDREREKRERDAAEYNRNREAERARFSSSALPNPAPSGTQSPSVPSYHGGYQPVLGPAGSSSYSSAPQQPQSRIQPYQVGSSSSAIAPGQWSSPQGRRPVSNNVLPPIVMYRDRDKDYDKEKSERDVTGKVDYRDNRSDRASQPKKEPAEDGKLHSPSSTDLKVPTMSATNTSSTGITPVSTSSSKSYSPPPSQPPSGPRLGTGALPPTGPRGGLPPTGPRAGIDRESRKEVDRKWGSKERGGSVEWNTAPQPHQYLHSQPQPQAAVVKTPTTGVSARLDVAHVHPDRIREIVKGEDDLDINHTHSQHVAEQPLSFGSLESGAANVPLEVWTTPTHPSSQRASSTTLSGPSRPGSSSSSGQGLRNILNPVNGPSNSAQSTPTAPAAISSSPAKIIQPPTAPRALQTPRGGVYWVRGRNFRGPSFCPVMKREVEGDGGFMGGHRNGRGGNMGMVNNSIGGGMRDMGGIGRGIDRVRRSSRAGAEVERPASREDVEMPDAHAHVRPKEEKKQEAPLKESKEMELPETPRSLPEKGEPTPEHLPPPPPPQTPTIKIEDPEDEEDDSLTQADVIFKIAEIDKDIEVLEMKLAELGKQKADHVAEIAKVDREIEHAAKAEAERSPRTMEPEVKAPIEFVVEMELDKEEPANPEQQTEENHGVRGKQESLEQQQSKLQQQERQQQERVEQQLQQQFQQQQEQHEMDLGRSKGVLRTPSISPPPTPSASNSPISSEAESEESFPNNSGRHPMYPDLPFYRPGPPMQPPDYDFFQANIEEHESIRELLVAHISEERKAAYEKETSLKRKFKDLFEAWYGECREMDKESTRKKKGNSEPAEIGISPVITAIMAPETVGRRAGRNASDVVRSEAEMEQVLKGLAEEEQQKAADTKAKDQNAREAVVPDMIMDPTEVLVFKDTNRLLRTNGDVLAAFRYNIPADDWTDTEHKVFCERYAMYPKQWGKIAQEIGGRDFKACILHYYMTKKTYSYKDLVRGPGKRGRTKGRRKAASSQRTRQSALIADLGRRGGVGEDDEGADSEDVTPAAITETGRPKRAAAPVFGIDANNSNNGNLDVELLGMGAGGKRGNKDSKGGDDDGEKTERGTKRTRGGNSTGREKQKRVKTPASVPAQPAPPPLIQSVLAPVPEKVEKKEEKKENLRGRESDAASALTEMGAIDMLPGPTANGDKKPVIIQQLNPQIQIPVEQPPTLLQQPPTLPTTPVPLPLPLPATPKKDKGDRAEKPIAQTSSYWSVPEQSDFPHLLASFGTNWAQISQRLASKTTVMVRNFYTRQVESGKIEYREIAEGADRKISAGEATPEPPKPAALPKKRYETTVVAPRVIMSNADPSATPPPCSSGTPGPSAVASPLPSTPTPIPIQMPVQLQVQPAAPVQSSAPPTQAPVSIKEEGAVKVQQPVVLPQLHSQPATPQSMKPVETPTRRPHSTSNPPHPTQLQHHISIPMPVQVGDMTGRPTEKFQERLSSERAHGGFPDKQQERMPEKFHERPNGRMHEMSNNRSQERPQLPERLPDRREIFPIERSHDRQGCVTEPMPERVSEMMPERMPEGVIGGVPGGAPGGVSDRMQDRLPERVQERPPAPERLFQERSHQSPPITPHPTAPHIHVHSRSLSQQSSVQQKIQGQQKIHVCSQHQHVPQRYFQEPHHQPQPFTPAPQQRPNHSLVTGPSSLEQRHQHHPPVDQRHQNPPPAMGGHHSPAVTEQRHHNSTPMDQRQQTPHTIQQSHQNAPSMLQAQQGHPPKLLQASVPRPMSAPQQLASCYQPPLSGVPQHQALRSQTHQLPANPTPPPPGPPPKRPTSINSLLNPKEDPPQPRPTYYTPQTRPLTRPQTPQQQQDHQQQQQQQHSQLQHPQPQHLPQYQHSQPQHSQQQHLQPQPQALHTQQREPPRREILYEQPRQQPTQLPIRGSHTLGMSSQSAFQSLPRETVSYPSASLREPTSYPAPPLREPTPQLPFHQPGHRSTLSGSHQPPQMSMYSRQYSPRPATTAYPPGRSPYAPPPPSIPPPSHHHPHPQQHPHHPQQVTPQHPLQHPQQQQHPGSLGHQLQQQHPHYPQHNTPPPQQSQSRDYPHHSGPPDQGYYGQ